MPDLLDAPPVDSGAVSGVATPAGADGASPWLQNIVSQYGSQLDITPPVETPDPAPVTATPEPAVDPAAPPVDPTPTPPVESPFAGITQKIKERYGEDLTAKYRDDEAAIQGLLHASRKIGERDERAQLGQLLMDRPDLVAQRLMQQMPHLFQQETQQHEPTAHKTNGTPSAGFKPEWLPYLTPAANIPQAVKSEMEVWLNDLQVQRAPSYQALKNELDAIKQQYGAIAQQVPQVQQLNQQQIEALRAQQLADSIVERNAERWYRRDANGQVVGHTPEGYLMIQGLTAAQQAGITDLQQALRYADMHVKTTRPQSAAPQAPAKTPGLTHSPNTSASPAANLANVVAGDNEDWNALYNRVAAMVQQEARQAG